MALVVSRAAITMLSSASSATGSISVSTISGGTAPYTVAWTSSSSASTISTPTTLDAKSNLLQGKYTIKVTDNVGALAQQDYDIAFVYNLPSNQALNSPEPVNSSYFGYPVAVDGEYIVVGESYYTSGSFTYAGAVYIYKSTNGTFQGGWTLKTKLLSDAPVSNGNFGSSVAIENASSTVVISEMGAAKVHVFTNSADVWTRQIVLRPSDNLLADFFGYTVSLSGLWLAVSAPNWSRKTPSSIQNCGVIYMFYRTSQSSAFTQSYSQLLARDPTANDYIGQDSMSLRSSQLVFPNSRRPPIVYVYKLTGSTWVYIQQIQPQSGSALHCAVYGNTLAVSTPYYIPGGSSVAFGGVYIYSYASTWTLTTILTGFTANQEFGSSVDLNGTVIVVGMSRYNSSTGAYAVYQQSGTQWSLMGFYTMSTLPSAHIGSGGISLSLTGKYIAASADGFSSGQGAVLTAAGPTAVAIIAITPAAVTNVNVYGQSTGSIGVTAFTNGTAPFTYSWTVSNGGSPISNPGVNDAKTSLSAGSYTITITDSTSTTASYTYVITQNPVLVITSTVTSASAPGASDGSIATSTVTGGSGTYTSYAWTSNSTVVASNTTLTAKVGLAAGTYTLLATDNVGGTVSRAFVVLENATLSVSGGIISPVLINGNSTGQITAVVLAGGSGAYSYSWSSGTGGTTITTPTTPAAKTALKAATYTLVVTDSRSVTATYSYIVTQNPVISLSGGATVTTTGSNGIIYAITASGGSGTFTSYAWTSSNGATAISSSSNLTAKTGLSAGTYTLVVTDSVGAVRTVAYVIASTPALLISVAGVITHSTLYNAALGSLTATTLTGGLLPLSYSWTSSSGATDVSAISNSGALTNLKAGTYQLSVTDAQGTVVHQSYLIGQPIYAVATFTNKSLTVNGTATITALGGLGAFTYAWTKDGAAFPGGASLTNLDVGIYVCTVTTSLYSALVPVTIATYMIMQASPTVLRSSWQAIPGATAYRVEYLKTADVDATLFIAKTLALFVIIPAVSPLTQYRVRVFATVGASATFVKYYSDVVTTPALVIENFSKLILQVGNVYDIVPLQIDGSENSDAVINATLAQGDSISFNTTVNGSTSRLTGTLVRNGFSYQIQKSSFLYLPFDKTDLISQQQATLILLDGSTKLVTYQASTDSVSIDGAQYPSGGTLHLSGEKVTVARSSGRV